MKAKEYQLMLDAVEEGVVYGIRGFFKHRDRYNIPEDEIQNMSGVIQAAVMSEICDRFEFESYGDRDG